MKPLRINIVQELSMISDMIDATLRRFPSSPTTDAVVVIRDLAGYISRLCKISKELSESLDAAVRRLSVINKNYCEAEKYRCESRYCHTRVRKQEAGK